jgi:hypothetical protein
LNGLPRSFDSTIQTLIHQIVALAFDQISSSLFTELHRREHRTAQLGNEEALAASFYQRASLGLDNNYSSQRRRRRQFFCGYQGVGPSRSLSYQARPVHVCYNCSQSNHIAWDYMAPQRGRGDQQSSQWPTYVNAVEFYDAAITKYHDNRP